MTPSTLQASFMKGLKPALYTAAWTFISYFVLALVGLLDEIGRWFESNGQGAFPDASVLVDAGRAGLMAAMAGLTGFVVRFGQSLLGRGNVPQYKADAIEAQVLNDGVRTVNEVRQAESPPRPPAG